MARRGRRIANALTGGAALAALLVLVPASGPAPAQQIEVEVTECDTPEAPDGCTTGSQKIKRDRGEQRIVVPVAPRPKPSAGASAAPVERHDVDLRSGTDRVRRTDGKKDREERVEVDVAKPKRDRERREKHDHEHGDASAPGPKTALDPVTTSGGSPFAGFGAGMEFVSTDEALARFAIPPFLVPIYVAAGRAYGVPWNVLAAINQIETDFGRIGRQVSTAGALGWMQFMPATWRMYGVDASGDGVADPYNPVDAIYAAARYLRASGAQTDLRRAVFSYNHADWYVDSVLKTAGVYGSLPGGLVAETGSLAFGRFPVLGRVSYGDDFRAARAAGEPARGLSIHGRGGAAAIATQDVTVKEILLDDELAEAFRHKNVPRRGLRHDAPSAAPAPEGRSDATDGDLAALAAALRPFAEWAGADPVTLPTEAVRVERSAPTRSAAPPAREAVAARGRLPEGFAASSQRGIGVVVEDALGNRYRYGGLGRLARGIRPGAELSGGRTIGRLASGDDPAMLFSVRAAGGAAVDPRPLVDGYRLQEVADFQHAVAPLGGSPFVPDTAATGGVVSGTQSELARRVLDDAGIDIYPGGRQDVARGIVDRRVLGALLYLRRNGLELTITSLRSGHSFYTAGGSVSAHSFGAAVDIAAFNGQPVLGNQGPGSLTEQAIKLLMGLEGEALPAQLISLMNFGGPSFAMGDHADHLHVGYHFQPSLGLGRSGDALGSVTFDGGVGGLLAGGKVDEDHERRLAGRLGGIDNPSVRRGASAAGVRVEAERPSETGAADALARRDQPLRAAPSAAGAEVVAVDVPEDARSDEAYAIGKVETSGGGEATRQVVLLAHSDGAWRVLGPPRDRRGSVVNPDLVALATVSGGRGYAVGDDGQVVVLGGDGGPLALGSVARGGDLVSVDVRGDGARVTGVAVGAAGTTVDLAGKTARVVRTDGHLADVTYAGDQAVAVGRRSGGPLVLRRSGGGWEPLAAPAARQQATLTAVAGDADALWVAGGVSDGGGAELPLVARFSGGAWETFCAGAPALAAVRELGDPTRGRECDRDLPLPAGTTGAAGDVATTRHGVVLATATGLQLFDGQAFRSLPAAPGTWPTAASSSRAPRLALTHPGPGWASGAGGRIARVTAADGAAREPDGGFRPAALTRGAPAAVAAAPGGGRVLALTDRSAALRGEGDWGNAPAPQVPLRELEWRTADEAWAVAETGELLRFDGERWTGGDGADDARARLAWALGGERYAAVGAPSGLSSLAFRSADEGFAVGARGVASRFDGSRWVAERTPVEEDLLAVAAGSDGVVAGGADGIVLERTGDGWQRRADAEALAAGRDVVAAAAASDGTLVVVAGGAVLAREPGADEWRAAPVASLGLDVRGLGALRSPDGVLRVVALAGPPESATLLLGDRDGWRPLAPGGLERVTDFDLDATTGTLWASGFAGEAAALAEVEVAKAAAPESEQVEKKRIYAHPDRAAVVAKEGK